MAKVKKTPAVAVTPRKSRKSQNPVTEMPRPLALEEIALFKQLPVLNKEQISRMLQRTIKQISEMTRSRAKRPLPVFKSGKDLYSTWVKLQQWIDEGLAERQDQTA